MNAKYQEILRLKAMLTNANIPFFFDEFLNGGQICYPAREGRICSVIEHDGSYGRESDTLEIMGLLTKKEQKHDDVCGNLTAETVFRRIKKHHKNAEVPK